VLLHQAGDGIEYAGAFVAVFGPRRLGFACGFDGLGDLCGGAFGDACKAVTCGRIM